MVVLILLYVLIDYIHNIEHNHKKFNKKGNFFFNDIEVDLAYKSFWAQNPEEVLRLQAGGGAKPAWTIGPYHRLLPYFQCSIRSSAILLPKNKVIFVPSRLGAEWSMEKMN